MRPQIVSNLNALASGGLLIDKLDFLAECESLYGRRAILDASVPWVNIMKLPGEVHLVSAAALLQLLTSSSSLFLCYGTGPWTAMKRWVASAATSVSRAETAIVMDDLRGDTLGYQSGDQEKVGTLLELWPRCASEPLFGTILQLVAEAWQMSLEQLGAQGGWHHSGSGVWGRLSRS